MKISVQKILTAFSLIIVPMFAFAQASRPSPPDKVSKNVGNTIITIDYSQPSVRGRTIWGELVPYGKVWRTGANAATIFEVSNDVKIEGKSLKAGKYSLFTIPEKNEWTIIFNEQTGQHGTQYNPEKDVLRVKVKPGKAPQMTEVMTFKIADNGVTSILWENVKIDFKVTSERAASQKATPKLL
jgi:hypothetical protein